MISGRLGVQIGFDRYELGPGDSISFDSSSPHRLWTIGDAAGRGDLGRRRPAERRPGFGLGGRGRPRTLRLIAHERATPTIEEVQMTTGAAPDLAAVKARQQATWASGDFAEIATLIVPVAELLADAADLRAGSIFSTSATGSRSAAIAAARLEYPR